ncbi:MAG TPA: exo-alpha-sialidase [Candidatus Thermoplasmatota archaeon]|nr:exo-alpha-sialidase [Candidatus Thermoplasmatota archaeon]
MPKHRTIVALGTRKGLFVLESSDRRRWRTRGPFFPGLPVHHAFLDPHDGKVLRAAVTSMHWGPTIQRSADLGARWTRNAGPTYAKDTGLSVQTIWHVAPGEARNELWSGVEPAGLFHSVDEGKTWDPVDGINRWPGREKWIPGGGGLCLHTILPYPKDPRRMVVGASAVGVFGTGDQASTWRLMNAGVQSGLVDGEATKDDQPGSCVHKVVRDARDPDMLYMQNHWGIYRRRRGDARWTDISRGLPSRFGFPIVAHPHDAQTVYTVPLEADTNRVAAGGAFAVYRTQDGGRKWKRLSKGLPQKGAWHTVLREGLATDGLDPAGLYVGTTTGQLYASRDDGDSWTEVATNLPPIMSVTAGQFGNGSR